MGKYTYYTEKIVMRLVVKEKDKSKVKQDDYLNQHIAYATSSPRKALATHSNSILHRSRAAQPPCM